MNLLIITQKVNRKDPALGFFHRWIEEFSNHSSKVTVICLELGENFLPPGIRVLSLGKESGKSRLSYLLRFFRYIWRERKNYDVVFVHMNEEYVILAGWWWKLTGKTVALWRNHIQGNWKTRLAVALSDVVFCTSPYSYTARFKKTKIVPAGVDMDKFKTKELPERAKRSILSMGRIDPVKNVDVFMKALIILDAAGIAFKADIVGDPSPGSMEYRDSLVRLASGLVAKGKIVFKPSVPNTETPQMYGMHDIFVNMTNSGSLDKTILSAMAAGTITIVSNTSFRGAIPDEYIFKEGDERDMAEKIEHALSMSAEEKSTVAGMMKKYAETQSVEHAIETVSSILASHA